MKKVKFNTHFLPVVKVIVLSGLFLSKCTLANHKNDFLLSEVNQSMNVEQCDETTKRLTQWEQMVFHDLGKSIETKLKMVNDFFNQMQWMDDKELWNKKDYWATPIESLIRNSGDCEDFAIAKYFTLLAMDIPEEQLKITFVRVNNQLGHMVLLALNQESLDEFTQVISHKFKDVAPYLQKSLRERIQLYLTFIEKQPDEWKKYCNENNLFTPLSGFDAYTVFIPQINKLSYRNSSLKEEKYEFVPFNLGIYGFDKF